MNFPKRLVLALAGAAAVVAVGGAAILGGVGVTQHSDMLYLTDGPDFKDVGDIKESLALLRRSL